MTDMMRAFIDVIDRVVDYVQPVMIFPALVLILLVFFYRYYFKVSGPQPGTTDWITAAVSKPKLTFFTQRRPMEKSDIAPLAVITAVFLFLALFQLGDTVAPQTFFQFSNAHKSIVIELNQSEKLNSMMFYTGLWTGHYKFEVSADSQTWIEQTPIESTEPDGSPTPAMDQPHSHLFKWRSAKINTDNPEVKYIRLTASRVPLELGELALFDGSGKLIPTSEISCPDAPELFDEQVLVPERSTYMNSMYFDEIYHGRTALEHLRNIKPYETTHPPLGKEIIAASIYVFGMTPFGWRFPGAVFGVIMLIVMYIFIKNLFGKTFIATCGTLLFAFDFMRFVQTRIATIDTYGVFFILLSYFFMYRYVTTNPDERFRKSLLPLALSGISFGIGCASKWIVIYAGIGLALIYVIRLILLAIHYNNTARTGFSEYLAKTLLFSVLFFIIIPVVIYCLSYIPYGLARGMSIRGGMLWDNEFYKIIWDNQVSMLSYHGKLVATHPYSSWWFQWIVDGRPILYVNNYNGQMRSSFSAFGNPVVWWGGFVAMVIMTIRVITKRDGKALFIVIGYLSQLLPWVAMSFIGLLHDWGILQGDATSRIVFIYHYFPSTIFLVLALAHVFNSIYEFARGYCRHVIIAYTALTGLVFAMFYPALTGIYVQQSYFRDFLKWIPGAWPM